MALSGSFTNTFTSGYQLKCTWSATQNVSANQSTITLNLYLVSLGSSYTISSGSNKDLQMYINDPWTDYGVNYNVSLSGNQSKLMQTMTRTITHDANGNASPTLSALINFAGVVLNGSAWNTVQVTQQVTLNSIPRNSTPASPNPANITAGVTGIPFTINQYITGVHHTVLLYVMNTDNSTYTQVTSLTNQGTSGTLSLGTTENTTIFNTLAQRASAPCIFRVRTYDVNNNQIGGDADSTGTMSAPAATTPIVPNFNIGDTVTVTLNAANSAFTHKLVWTFGSYTRTLAANNPNGNYSWATAGADASGMYPVIPNAASGIGGLVCTTYYNSVQVQSPVSSGNVTATVVNSNPTFTTISYLDNNTTIAALTGNNQYIVQNQSDMLAKVLSANKAVALNSATITKYIATVAGESLTVVSPFATDILFDFSTIVSSTNQTLTITAYDSRGFTTAVSLTVNVVPYSPPTVVTTAARQSGFGATVTITLSGTISPLNVNGVNKNSLAAANTNYEYRVKGGSYNAATAFTGQTLTMPNYSATNVTLTLANTSAWDILVTVTDQISSVAVTLTVAIGVPIMFWDKVMKNVGIGKFPSASYLLDVAGAANFDGAITAAMPSLIGDATNGWLRFVNNGSGVFIQGANGAKNAAATIMLTGLNNTANTVKTFNNTLDDGSGNMTVKGITAPAWTALTLGNGWVNIGGVYSTAAYRKNALNQVELKGNIGSGTTTSGTVIATLPVGFRPTERRRYTVLSNNTSGDQIAQVDIDTSGNIIVILAYNTYLSLDSIPAIPTT